MNPKDKSLSLRSVTGWFFGGVAVIAMVATTPGGKAAVISDNFNDGNDTAPTIAWTRLDPIGLALGGPPAVFAHWSFPNGNSYRIQADASPDVVNIGPGRAVSIAPGNYTNFYVAVDVIDFDDTVHQFIGIAARLGTPGPGTTSGYMFGWDSGNPGGTSGDMDIVRLDNESPTDLDSHRWAGDDGVHLVKGNPYRFVFMGQGGIFRGQVYDLSVSPPVVIVDYFSQDPNYDPNGSDHVSGTTALVVANNCGACDLTADATFDNFYASNSDPLMVCDDFDRQNDDGWTEFAPAGGSGTPLVQTFSFPANPASANNYGYKMTCNPQLLDPTNPARVGSFRTADRDMFDFYVASDLINWDNTTATSQQVGVAARVTTPITTAIPHCYALVYVNRFSSGSGGTDQLRIYKLNDSGATFIHDAGGGLGQFGVVPGGSPAPNPANSTYRLVFRGVGALLTGQIIDIKTGQALTFNDNNGGLTNQVQATDSDYVSGQTGLIGFQNNAGGPDPTFDNFLATIAPPTLSVQLDTVNNATLVSWPVLSGIWLLQSTSDVTHPATWTTITSGITRADQINTYSNSPPTGNQFFRLLNVCND